MDGAGVQRRSGHHQLHRHLEPRKLTCSTATTSCTVTGLTNGTSYTFTVTATNPAGTGTTSAASAPAIRPPHREHRPASTPRPTPTPSRWSPGMRQPPTAAQPSPPTRPPRRPGGFTCSAATTSCTVTGLTNGTSYTFTVTATNSAGTSAVLGGVGRGHHRPPCPGAPTGVTATSNANTQSVVSWTAPASNGGAAISSYTVTSAPGGLHLLDRRPPPAPSPASPTAPATRSR